MKSEEFIGLLGGIDSKFVEKASEDMVTWQESQHGESISAGSPRKASLWLPIASVACAAAAVVGGFFLIRNIRQNGSFDIVGNTSSSAQGGDTDSKIRVPVSTEIPESSPVSSGGSSESVPAVDKDPTKLSYDDMKFEAVDPFNDLITYSWAVEPDRISYELLNPSPVSSLTFEEGEIPMQYMYEFFGTGNSPIWVGPLHWKRCLQDGHFEFEVAQDEYVRAPVGGRVITVADSEEFYGKAVAVEIPGQKIFVMYHLDEVYVKVGDIVTEDQELGLCSIMGAGKHRPVMVIMKKKTDPPQQELSKEFDGLTLEITTNKTVYEVGEPIHLTATVENNMGKDIYISYGWSENHFSLSTRIEDLVEYPRRVGGVIDDIAGFKLFTQGEKVVQDFTFQTYTGYCREIVSSTADYDGVLRYYPDPDKPAESGTYFGYLGVTVYDIPNLNFDEGKNYMLEFTINIKGEDAEDEIAVAETTNIQYTEDMLKDYFIYKGVLYTNCYTDHIDWAVGEFEQLESGKVGELVAVIDGKADLQRFKDNTANVLPKGTKIYEFPDNSELLIARSGDEYIPYMGLREG